MSTTLEEATFGEITDELSKRMLACGGAMVLAFDLPGKVGNREGLGTFRAVGRAPVVIGLATLLHQRLLSDSIRESMRPENGINPGS